MSAKKKHSKHTVTVHVSPGWAPEDWKRFVELPYFTATWAKLGLNDEDLRSLQIMLTVAPTSGTVVAGTGGLRKLRFARAGSGRGKSGGFRIGYVYFEEYGVIGLLIVYAKVAQSTIAAAQKRQIKHAIERLRDWIAAN